MERTEQNIFRMRPRKSLAARKAFLIYSICICLLISVISTTYLSVPAYAFTFPNSAVRDLLVANLIASTSLSSYGAVVNDVYNTALIAQWGQKTVGELLEEYENAEDPNAYLNSLDVMIDAADSAGATGLSDWLEITQAEADAVNEGLVEPVVRASSAAENLILTAAQTVEDTAKVIANGAADTTIAVGSAVAGTGAAAASSAVGAATSIGNLVSSGVQLASTALQLSAIGRWGSNIQHGASMTTPQSVIANAPNGCSIAYLENSSTHANSYFYIPDGVFFGLYKNNNNRCWGYFINTNYNDAVVNRYKYKANGSSDGTENINVNARGISYNASYVAVHNPIYYGITLFETGEELTNYKNTLLADSNPTSRENASPDIITPNGNAQYDTTNNNYNFTPTYNINNQYMSPVDITNNDYNNFVNNINNNNTINNYAQNETVYNNFVNNYINQLPEELIDTTPDIPTQPTVSPQPTLTPEQEEQNKQYITPDLREYFPFCIPFDIYAMLTHFSAIDRDAPNITWTIPLGSAGTYTVNINLERFDDIAALFRTLEMILFIIGLAMASRKLIGD